MPPKIFVVEGNIAAGKSTFIGKLQSKFVHVAEPIDEWEKTGIFQLYNTDPVHNAYKFQTYAFVTRIQAFLQKYAEHGPDATYLLERSWHSDRLFARANYEAGYFTEMEWKMYNDWCDLHEKLVPMQVTGFIYLKTSANVCYSRLHQRHRSTEELLKLTYLESLERSHDEFFASRSHLLIANNVDNDTSNAVLIDNYVSSFGESATTATGSELEDCSWRIMQFVESLLKAGNTTSSTELMMKMGAFDHDSLMAELHDTKLMVKLISTLVYASCLCARKGGSNSPFLAKIVADLKSFPGPGEGDRRQEWLDRLEKISETVDNSPKLSVDDISFVFFALNTVFAGRSSGFRAVLYAHLAQDMIC